MIKFLRSLYCNQSFRNTFKFIRRCISAVWPRLWPQLEILRNCRASQIQSNSCHSPCESACWWRRLADSVSGLSVFSYFYLVTKPWHIKHKYLVIISLDLFCHSRVLAQSEEINIKYYRTKFGQSNSINQCLHFTLDYGRQRKATNFGIFT